MVATKFGQNGWVPVRTCLLLSYYIKSSLIYTKLKYLGDQRRFRLIISIDIYSFLPNFEQRSVIKSNFDFDKKNKNLEDGLQLKVNKNDFVKKFLKIDFRDKPIDTNCI